MRKPNVTLLPLVLLSASTLTLLASAPACIDAPDSVDDSIERSIKEVDLDMCPKFKDMMESGDYKDILKQYQFVCGLVIDSDGNKIEDGLVIRINGKAVSDDSLIEWQRERDEDQQNVRIDISAPGYAPLIKSVSGSLFNQPFVLQRLNETEIEWGEKSLVTDASGATVKIPAYALVTKSGEKPEGSILFGTFFVNPALQDLPGDYSAINNQGELVYLQSYGTVFMGARDEAGNQLVLAPGEAVQVTVPLDERLAKDAPETIALWSFDRSEGIWKQTEGKGTTFEAASLELAHDGHPTDIQAPDTNEFYIWDCSDFPPTDPCFPEHCKYNSTRGTTGEFGSLGYINFDMEKTDPGCIVVDIDESAISPEDFPVCLQFEIAGPAGPIIREECMGPDGTLLYNIPAFSDVAIDILYTYGCPAGVGGQMVNSGAPWGGVGMPSNPGDCNGSIVLPPF